MKAFKGYYNIRYFKQDLNVLIRFIKLKNLKVHRLSKFCVEFRSKPDNFRFSYDFQRERTELEHWNTNLYNKNEMRRLFISNEVCDFLFLSKGYDHLDYK